MHSRRLGASRISPPASFSPVTTTIKPGVVVRRLSTVLRHAFALACFTVGTQCVVSSAPAGEDAANTPYHLRIMRDGSEAEIFGGFRKGLAREFIAFVIDHPKLKTIHLTSGGGLVGEGLGVARAIRQLKLDTYVSRECDSACTLAFAAGKRRWLDRDASLGFHAAKSRYGGVLSSAMSSSPFGAIAMSYRVAGFSEAFIAKATTTPNADLWRPSLQELRDNGVVTDLTDGSDFAWSGFPPDFKWKLFADGIAEGHPAFASLRTHDAATYAQLAAVFEKGYADMKSRKAVLTEFGTAINKVIRKNWGLADDASMLSLAAILADEYQSLGRKDASVCFRYAQGSMTNGELRENVAPELWTRHSKWQGTMIASAKPNANRSDSRKITRDLHAQVVRALGPKKVALLAARTVKPRQYPEYCEAITAEFRTIATLPAAKAGPIMRTILKSVPDDQPRRASR